MEELGGAQREAQESRVMRQTSRAEAAAVAQWQCGLAGERGKVQCGSVSKTLITRVIKFL